MKTIKLLVKDKNDFYDKYSLNVSNELIDYLITEGRISEKLEIELTFVEKIENANILLKEGLEKSYNDLICKDKFHDYRKIFLTFLGVIMLIASSFIKGSLIHELLLIAGWVAIWDVIDFNLNNNIVYMRKKKILENLMQSEIIVK